MHNFYFADKWLSYFCGRFVQAPQHEISKRDISAIEIPYKDGDILLDNGRGSLKEKFVFCRICLRCPHIILLRLLLNG